MCRPPFRSRCMADTDGKRSAAIAKGRRRRLEAEAVPGGGVREEAPLLQRRRKGRAVAVPGALASAHLVECSCPSCKAGDALPERLQGIAGAKRSEEHTSELQSLMRISYAVFCLKKKTYKNNT